MPSYPNPLLSYLEQENNCLRVTPYTVMLTTMMATNSVVQNGYEIHRQFMAHEDT